VPILRENAFSEESQIRRWINYYNCGKIELYTMKLNNAHLAFTLRVCMCVCVFTHGQCELKTREKNQS
jgi:hypothetical protein